MFRSYIGPMALLGVVAACSTSTPTAPLTVTGYTLAVTTPIRTDSVTTGDSILVTFKVTANESDGSTKPAAGDTVNVRVAAGGGSLTNTGGAGGSGFFGAVLTTGADGMASIIWVIGPTAGVQSLQVVASDNEVVGLDLNVGTNTFRPTVRLIGGEAGGGVANSGDTRR